MDARDFTLEKAAVLGLLLCTGALAVAGVLSLFGTVVLGAAPILKTVCIFAMAGMAGFSLFVAQSAASCAQLLDGDDVKHARFIAYFCEIVTGLVSVAGVYLGDAILRGHHAEPPPLEAMLVGGFLLAFIKPAMSYVITACETHQGAKLSGVDAMLAVKDRRIAELEAELRKARSPAENPLPANDQAPAAKPPRATPAQCRSVAKALRNAEQKARNPAPVEGRERPERRPPLTEAELRKAIAEMVTMGKVIDIAKVAKHCGIPYSRVERSPGRHLIDAARAV